MINSKNNSFGIFFLSGVLPQTSFLTLRYFNTAARQIRVSFL